MRPGAGKSKGAGFEREVCKRMSLLVSNGKQDDLFWRSAMSGGRASLADGKTRIHQAGDVSAVSAAGAKFLGGLFVECKFYRNLNLESFFLDDTGKLARFWHEAKAKARYHGKIPMLIAKQNGKLPLLLVEYGLLNYGPKLHSPFAVVRGVRCFKLDQVFPPKAKYKRLLKRRNHA